VHTHLFMTKTGLEPHSIPTSGFPWEKHQYFPSLFLVYKWFFDFDFELLALICE
jgi:hypothetical protein